MKPITTSIAAALIIAGLAGAKERLDGSGVSFVPPSAVVKGSMVDARNQTKYATVRIGTQVWMAENLDFKTDSSWCYDDNPDRCESYGRLYSWRAALNACPGGWHLPSDLEWSRLVTAVGGTDNAGKALKGTEMKGTNAYGFTVLPAGNRINDGRFSYVGSDADFWSATEVDAGNAWYRSFDFGGAEVLRVQYDKTGGRSVRCLEN